VASASDATIDLMFVQLKCKTISRQRRNRYPLLPIIYAAIDDLKDAMEGMLAPEMKEEILASWRLERDFQNF
jgi:translation initiation factor IF-2